MKEERIPITELIDQEEDACVRCSEKTVNCCGILHIKRWCLFVVLLLLLTVGFLVPFVIYAVLFGEATSCRLTYSDNSNVTEAEMQKFMSGEDWSLTVPTYDMWKRRCVCKGSEDEDPLNLKPTDEVLAWIAPGDLVSLSDEEMIAPPLPSTFLTKYRGQYYEQEHVKVCIPQKHLLNLWNYNDKDGSTHCHVQSSQSSSNVEQFYLGWDGALYCSGNNSLQSPSLAPH